MLQVTFFFGRRRGGRLGLGVGGWGLVWYSPPSAYLPDMSLLLLCLQRNRNRKTWMDGSSSTTWGNISKYLARLHFTSDPIWYACMYANLGFGLVWVRVMNSKAQRFSFLSFITHQSSSLIAHRSSLITHHPSSITHPSTTARPPITPLFQSIPTIPTIHPHYLIT